MIARDHRRAMCPPQPPDLLRRLRLPLKPRPPTRLPRRKFAVRLRRPERFELGKRVREIRLRRPHPLQQRPGQRLILRLFVEQPEFPPHPRDPVAPKALPEPSDRLVGQCDRRRLLRMEHRQQCLRKPRDIPLRDLRLIAIGVAPVAVDRAEHRRRIIRLHEGTRPVIDRLARERHVVRVHHPVHETHAHPLRHQARLPLAHRFEQGERQILRARELRVVPLRRVGHEGAQRRLISPRRHPLKRPDAEVARRHPREHRPRPRSTLPPHVLARRHHGQTPRRRNSQRLHRFADHIFAQHGPECRPPVAPARKRRRPRALQLHIKTLPTRRDLLPQ